MESRSLDLIEQHKRRLEWMPWLYFKLKPKHLEWAVPWQKSLQRHLETMETVCFGENCFLASSAQIFAEPRRPVVIGNHCSIGALTFVHGKVTLGDGVSLNPKVTLDGGTAGIEIGRLSRIAQGVSLFAFNHGMDPNRSIQSQNVRSKGIRLGEDVWIGAQVCICDGVQIGSHAVVGMGSVVTKDVEDWAIVAGNPARVIGDRRKKV